MKANKSLCRISIATTPEAEDAIAEQLGAILSRPASAYFDLETGKSTVSVFCEQKPHRGIRKIISEALGQIKKCGLAIGPGKISITKVRREDWAESWKRHFKPIEIFPGRARHSARALPGSLLIKPSWSRRKPLKNQAVVVLDPGLSFGTGQHPTTAFCLREIVRSAGGSPVSSGKSKKSRTSRPRSSFLDIGTGSGILAIAAAKLGFSPADAFDFDPNAVNIARANARRNGVGGKIRFWRGDVTKLRANPARRYDLVCANLISTLLIAERQRIAAQLKPGGTLALAGILKSEFTTVKKSFMELGLKLVRDKSDKEWWSGSFRSA